MKKIFYQSIYKIILIKIFFFLVLNSSAYSFYKKNFDVVLPEEIFIKLEKKELGQYGNNIYEIINDKSPNIHPKYKKYLDGKISFKIKDNYVQNDIDIRIIGDWKDHIDSENLITSLQVKIKNKNIGGIKKFRLYLPHTRLGENEILWSAIHEVYGFPTLHRQFIKVNFNNKNYIALFEESTEKEFLERWSFRESPIIEYDERQIWLDRYNSLNEKLIDKESDRYKIDNASFIKNDLDTIITQRALKIKNNFIIESFDKLNKDVGKHGLIKHNRKYIYDPIYNLHLPLYFDGNINFDKTVFINNKCQYKTEKQWEQKKEQLSSKLNLIIDLFEDRSKKNVNDRTICIVKNILIEKNFNLDDFISDEVKKSVSDLNNFQYQNKMIEKRNDQSFYFGYNIEEKTFCKSTNVLFEKCDQLEYNEIRNLLVGRLSVSQKSIPYNIGFYNFKKNRKILNQFENFKIQEDMEISVDSDTNPYVKIFNNSKSKINLKINLNNDRTSKLIIFDSKLDNLNISLNSLNRSAEKFDNNVRYNENLLTGCLTIIDSKFDNVSISSNGTACEDDINIFRSIGNIDNISIKNSDYDSIDFDYSNLKIKNVNIKGAGNDCLDFSFGNILVEKIIVEIVKIKE